MALKVDYGGLTVNAPVSLPLSRIEAFVRESERWVLRKLEEWGRRRVPEVSWRDGDALPWLGDSLVLRTALGAPRVTQSDGELRVATRTGDPDAVRRAVIGWYKRAALPYLSERAALLAERAGLAPPRIFISPARTRWGSCNSRREVRLAWRLAKAPPRLVDYVICHELAHLRHMNHSRAFWAEVERQCPGHQGLRDELHRTDHLYRSF